VRLVIAESFERIYRQNADNLGLLTSTDLGLLDRLQRGEWPTLDELLADREPLAAAILRAGGLLPTAWGLKHRCPRRPAAADAVRQDRGAPPRAPGLRARRPGASSTSTTPACAAHLLQAHAGDALQLHDPGSIVCFEDHLSYVRESPVHVAQGLVQPCTGAVARRTARLRSATACRTTATLPAGPGSQGISHALVAERYALPGQLVVGTDSHTPHSGALGCVAFRRGHHRDGQRLCHRRGAPGHAARCCASRWTARCRRA
jgi:3-isopropylmalate/(R)-2-methylmalate dehydratase large subunit